MNRGSLTANQALKNTTQDKFIHDEIYLIEKNIREVSQSGFRSTIIDFTTITNNIINSEQQITQIDISSNIFTLSSHSFVTDDIVVLRSSDTLPVPLVADKEYKVEVIDTDTFRLLESSRFDNSVIDLTNIGVGNTFIRKIIPSEQFYKSWAFFYTYEDSESKLYIITAIETHFKSMGYEIKKFENPITKTFYWKLEW